MKFSKNQEPVVFFDGECGLCDRSVAYLLRSENAARLRYAPQSGSTFQSLISLRPDVEALDSLIIWDPVSERYFTEATGVAFALKRLGGIRGFLGFLLGSFPKFIANPVYRWIARNRLRFFPHKGLCSILSEKKRALILP